MMMKMIYVIFNILEIVWDDDGVKMKGSVQWSAIQSWAEFRLQWDSNPGPRAPN